MVADRYSSALRQRLGDLLEPDDAVIWHAQETTQRLLDMMSNIHLEKVDRAQRFGTELTGTLYKRTRLGKQRAEVRFDGISGCLRTPEGGSSRQTVLQVRGSRIRSRLLTPREAARLMGLPDSYILPKSYNEAYHVAGDGLVVPVVAWIEQHLLRPLLEADTSLRALPIRPPTRMSCLPMSRLGVPADVEAIRTAIAQALDTRDAQGRRIGDSRFGVYAFFDYDGEPIYVGQTKEKLRVRIRRHLTNHRTDAVAMNVLDPFEVADIEMWPLWDLQTETAETAAQKLNAAEYTVFEQVLATSLFTAVLNEKDIAVEGTVTLPPSLKARIVPAELFEARKHPDVRIARRAATIASLAKVISERDVSPGLRRTLVTQARRLEHLAAQRFGEFANDPIEVDQG